jgi:hypothetical protein
MVLSLLEAILILSGVLSEPQWGIQSLLTWNMLLLGMRIVGRRITEVCAPFESMLLSAHKNMHGTQTLTCLHKSVYCIRCKIQFRVHSKQHLLLVWTSQPLVRWCVIEVIWHFFFHVALLHHSFLHLPFRGCVCQMIYYWDLKIVFLWYGIVISILNKVIFDKDFLHKKCLKFCKCCSSLQIMEDRPVSELKFMCFFLPGNYIKFYNAIRSAYPDIKIISNCDGSSRSLDHPADYYDYHVNILSW